MAMVGKVEETSLDSEKHTGEVTSLIFYNEHLFSAGSDGIIKIWDKDLELIKNLPAHNTRINALAINEQGGLYSSSQYSIKYFKDPLKSDESQEIFRAYKEEDELCSLYCTDDGSLYAGAVKGIVTRFVDNKVTETYNVSEEVRSMAVEKHNLYTAKDLDAMVLELLPGKIGKPGLMASIEGRAPLALVDPNEFGHSKYLVFTTRDGLGMTLVRNVRTYPIVWRKDVSRWKYF